MTKELSQGKMFRHLLLQACALHKLRIHFEKVFSAFLQTSASEEHQELMIKAPPEVGYLFSDCEGKPAPSHRNFLSMDGNPCRLINACGVVTLMTVSWKGSLEYTLAIS